LYRITREALNNVIVHAEATRVDITLLNKPDRVELRIRDDGRGFDPQAVSAGRMGLHIMLERAAKIGGDMQVQSQPGRGTEISVTWLNSTERASDE
jgi:signal transduction histidine kinase